jgi:tight adherence protein B
MTSRALLGAALGILAAGGVLIVLWVLTSPPRVVTTLERVNARVRCQRRARQVLIASAAGLAGGVAALLVTGVAMVGLLGVVLGAAVPGAVRRRRERQQARRALASWPDAVDALAAGVRAGQGIAEATAAVGTSGPEPLRPLFAAFAIEYRATGSMADALTEMRERATDPIADRVVAALSLAREVGGTDLGVLLRSLSMMLREDARTRAEIQARQSWTVAAARMAVAAPWVTLALLCTRTDAVDAYLTPGGTALIAGAAVLSAFAYVAMLRIARLPGDVRIAS